MMCKQCNEGEMAPTQVPRMAQGLGKMGYILALGAVLVVGSVVGLGLAVARDGSVDLSWALVATPVFLVVCTPLVAFGALRAFAERKVWQCTHCDQMLDRE